jgi:hypothetical protein
MLTCIQAHHRSSGSACIAYCTPRESPACWHGGDARPKNIADTKSQHFLGSIQCWASSWTEKSLKELRGPRTCYCASEVNFQAKSRYMTTDGQPASPSWCPSFFNYFQTVMDLVKWGAFSDNTHTGKANRTAGLSYRESSKEYTYGKEEAAPEDGERTMSQESLWDGDSLETQKRDHPPLEAGTRALVWGNRPRGPSACIMNCWVWEMELHCK